MEENTKVVEETKIEKIPVEKPTTIKKYLERPATRKEKRKRNNIAEKYERAYLRRYNRSKDKSDFKKKIAIGLVITLAIILVLRYLLQVDMTSILSVFMRPSLAVTAGLIVVSFTIMMLDRTTGVTASDPITDYFIISKGKIGANTKSNHLNKINTRFMMVTFLKLYKKDQIAISNEKIIYGTMDGYLAKDEVALLNFMLDHDITTVSEFIDVIKENQGKKNRLGNKDHLYGYYKEAILQMAMEKHYVNQSINKAKLLLRTGGLIFTFIVLALVAKGQGTLEMLGIFGLQAVLLFSVAHFAYAHSRGAHKRIAELRKERRMMRSNKVDDITALIYFYLFGKEERGIRRIQKSYESGKMSKYDYGKFAETYNGFNYVLDFIKKES